MANDRFKTDEQLGVLMREAADQRREISVLRTQIDSVHKTTREEIRNEIETMGAGISKALESIAKLQGQQSTELNDLKLKQNDDEIEKTRAKTAVTIFRVIGGALASILISICGYLLGSYIEVRDQTRDNTTAIAQTRETATRLEHAQAEASEQSRSTREEVIAVRTKLTGIDGTLNRIEEAVDGHRRRRP